MNEYTVDVVIGVLRLLLYVGFVLYAGTLAFWFLVWPEGTRNVHLVRNLRIGWAVLLAMTVIIPIVRWQVADVGLTDLHSRESGAAALVRIAVLALSASAVFGTPERPVTRTGSGWSVLGIVIICATLVVQSNAIEGNFVILKVIATMGHLLATACWLGGLASLATVIIPREDVRELDRLIPTFSKVAFTSVIVLVVTGTLHGLTIAGGISELIGSSYGLWLGIKAAIFALMLIMGNHGRKYANSVVFRRMNAQDAQESSTVQTLAVVMGAEVAIAAAVLGATATLVAVAPPAF